MSTNYVSRACVRPANGIWIFYLSWREVLKCGAQKREVHARAMSHPRVRHMSVFQEFARRVKGEIQSNAELQKSIQELKERAGDLKNRTKETTEQLYKHVDAAREEAEARARQASTVVKEKVSEAKERVSEATVQVKESVGSFKFGKLREENKDLGKNAEEAASGSSASGTSTHEFSTNRFSKFLSGLSASVRAAMRRAKNEKLIDMVTGGFNFIKEELTAPPSRTRARSKFKIPFTTERSDSTSIVPVTIKKSKWEKQWDGLKEKAQAHPIYRRLKGVKEHPAVAKGQEIAEDLREKWETSDSPVVHKIQDWNESLFGETATAMALREIRRREPAFSFPDFIVEVQESIRPVLQAYLKGDLPELRKRCTQEVVDRCRAEKKAYESQGIFLDNKLLHISDVEVKETKLLGNVPIIIVSFQTQQIYCVRDLQGRITQGAKDDIHTVYYAWAMQQMSFEELKAELHPRWQLREMQQLGIQAII